MPLLSPGVSDGQTAVGIELVQYLTRDASDLAPRLVTLMPSYAEALITQAIRQGVAPWLRRCLIEQGLYGAVPAPARDCLDREYIDNSARSMARYRELRALLGRLAEVGIPVIALKGIYLAKAVYPEPGLRPMSDMDLLFRERDLEQVQALLFELGYGRSESARPIGDFLKGSELPTFERPGSASLDVHMRIERASAPFSIDCEGLWERAHPWPLEGRPLLALSPEDLLLHLCLHATYHHRFRVRLNALIDIARVAEIEPLNWPLFVERACDWQAELPVFMGLSLARRLMAAAIPEDVLFPLTPLRSVAAELVHAEQTILAARHDGYHEKVLAFQRTRQWHYLHRSAELSSLPHWRAKLWYLLSKVFPSKASLLFQYPWFRNSGWVRLMYSVHWLVVTGRLVRAMASDRRSWLAWQRLGRRWSS